MNHKHKRRGGHLCPPPFCKKHSQIRLAESEQMRLLQIEDQLATFIIRKDPSITPSVGVYCTPPAAESPPDQLSAVACVVELPV